MVNFLELAPEIRNSIYEYFYSPAQRPDLSMPSSQNLNLLLTCRQIYNEVHVIAFANTNHIFHDSRRFGLIALKGLRLLSEESCKLVRSVVVVVPEPIFAPNERGPWAGLLSAGHTFRAAFKLVLNALRIVGFLQDGTVPETRERNLIVPYWYSLAQWFTSLTSSSLNILDQEMKSAKVRLRDESAKDGVQSATEVYFFSIGGIKPPYSWFHHGPLSICRIAAGII
ncbi:hypothetical protein EV356DRAFT_517536 [Viridothelium virens]|uniref:Uncharacterized protein n=1 Tax=Viridothelium virens TaxID=1048519 RepID=A0A6A6H2Y9_VIRVR|nr:hypothetical protein EV356DRAFT_517536 [Viridothelium virens]